jgi:hypothetical protein
MNAIPLDKQLLNRLQSIDEFELAGFVAREGLTGSGVTVLKGRTYFGSWRLTGGNLVWSHASANAQKHTEESVDGAIHYTAILVLKNLELDRDEKIAALARLAG